MMERRIVLAGICGAGCAAALGGCATYGAVTPAPAAAPVPVVPGAPDPGLAPVSSVPVGGGVVLADRQIVLTQPVAGTFKAFSSTCTHQGCQVAEVAGGTINCPCHGSTFAVADGSVVSGPATRPLPERPVKVDGTVIRGA
ncbi:MAG: Rieske (2Fe-2S) protein [Pseudonocardia sp.]|jgi:nitrite reductase/ring-hydroxylating ferredoxin subunit|uniref:Rieske (2Fe-2S) protein n=1 Tax=Pseudonocardia sp. TaxID=60912 RepID=UPI001ACA6DE7|nr:Rieske (2Fe-2S) protein [Pseudonocardia sp.]MBN9101735.1 Rieske (2Fe-2S) protein [Pseudonocardia sp.]